MGELCYNSDDMEYILRDNWLDISIDSLFVETIQDFFDSYIPSKKIQHLLIQNKNILLDGNPVKREDPIVGLYLNINLYPETYVYSKCDLKPDIVYEDEILLIVNKPKDVLVHSDGNEWCRFLLGRGNHRPSSGHGSHRSILHRPCMHRKRSISDAS